MPRIFITSGTSYQLPQDFNPGNNTVECYGSGEANTAGGGGGGGAYAKVTNINVSPGVTVNIHIGSAGARNTWFNATSLANAVSNGVSISCGAAGAIAAAGGLASSSCGTVKYNGGGGGGTNGYGGGGGGGAGGPNGAGADGGWGGTGGGNYGGGGGGSNGGARGSDDPAGSNYAGAGGNNRLGAGGGAPGSYPSPGPIDGGAGSNGGGGGGAAGVGGAGSLENIYSTSSYGPGSGGGGGAAYSNGVSWAGGNGGGHGGGGGGSGVWGGGGGNPGIGLIVITYVSAPPYGIKRSAPYLGLRAPSIPRFPIARRTAVGDTPNQNLSWMRQPLDRVVAPGRVRLWAQTGGIAAEHPNPTPLYKNPWEIPPDILKIPRFKTLDTRQQFPGLAPKDFHATIIEEADVFVSAVGVTSPINASLFDYDVVTALIDPVPAKGGADDIIRRVKLELPKGWWRHAPPIRDAIIGGIADGAAWCYGLVSYAKLQSRVAWATDLWLDIISKDYFGLYLPRKTNESDDRFRARIQKELIRERVTRKGMTDALNDLTGNPPVIFEPWNTGDTGAWDVGNFALDIAGGWGDTILPAQSFVNVVPPGAGIPGAGGWDGGMIGWDVAGMWGDMSQIAGAVTDQDVYDTINRTRPTGSIVWTQLFKPEGPMPVPSPKTRTPSFAPPGMISPVVRPGPQRYSMSLIPPLGGPKSRVLT